MITDTEEGKSLMGQFLKDHFPLLNEKPTIKDSGDRLIIIFQNERQATELLRQLTECGVILGDKDLWRYNGNGIANKRGNNFGIRLRQVNDFDYVSSEVSRLNEHYARHCAHRIDTRIPTETFFERITSAISESFSPSSSSSHSGITPSDVQRALGFTPIFIGKTERPGTLGPHHSVVPGLYPGRGAPETDPRLALVFNTKKDAEKALTKLRETTVGVHGPHSEIRPIEIVFQEKIVWTCDRNGHGSRGGRYFAVHLRERADGWRFSEVYRLMTYCRTYRDDSEYKSSGPSSSSSPHLSAPPAPSQDTLYPSSSSSQPSAPPAPSSQDIPWPSSSSLQLSAPPAPSQDTPWPSSSSLQLSAPPRDLEASGIPDISLSISILIRRILDEQDLELRPDEIHILKNNTKFFIDMFHESITTEIENENENETHIKLDNAQRFLGSVKKAIIPVKSIFIPYSQEARGIIDAFNLLTTIISSVIGKPGYSKPAMPEEKQAQRGSTPLMFSERQGEGEEGEEEEEEEDEAEAGASCTIM